MDTTQIFFALSLLAMGWAILRINLDPWARGFLAMGTLMCVFSSINLSKTIRDQHEASRMSRRVEGAKLERILAEHDPLSV